MIKLKHIKIFCNAAFPNAAALEAFKKELATTLAEKLQTDVTIYNTFETIEPQQIKIAP